MGVIWEYILVPRVSLGMPVTLALPERSQLARLSHEAEPGNASKRGSARAIA
ncbi:MULTISPECIES: hypothetical protein [Planktothricoides]|uniref:Uncharacterized protein n=1 Tax=Planktothricoides raciborskii FACHB-1370 TaxID=2949576 RepID=A0ABR8EHU9_9CYAN|nr:MULTISPECIES: hypothetical protein [Planktothricoides]MBD2545728.1 hypothetical protein [Planktothricoides raciborskii FACHB-1370]